MTLGKENTRKAAMKEQIDKLDFINTRNFIGWTKFKSESCHIHPERYLQLTYLTKSSPQNIEDLKVSMKKTLIFFFLKEQEV